MSIKSNIPELIEKLESVKAQIASSPDIANAMFSAINAGMGKMKFRIFNKGNDAQDATLGVYVGPKTKITSGKYSIKNNKAITKRVKKLSETDARYTEYEKYRLSKGRQVDYKDLEVEGALRRSIGVVRDGENRVVVAISNEETALIAGYQEKQIGNIRAGLNPNTGDADPIRIFGFSESEYNFVKAEGNAAIKQVIQKILAK